MGAQASCGVGTRARKRNLDLTAQAGVAFPGLPSDVAFSIVEKHLPDPADLAVLRAVSKGMRDAVDATGRKVEEFKDCLLYTSPSPRDKRQSRMPSSA